VRKYVTSLLLIALILAALPGCASSARYQTSALATQDIVLLDGDMDASREWQKEAEKRFVHPVIVTVHGRTVAGKWYCFPQHPRQMVLVADLAQSMHERFPGRDIVLIVCNEDGHAIHVPHVWYAQHKVWVRPTASLYPWERGERNKSVIVGDITQFVN